MCIHIYPLLSSNLPRALSVARITISGSTNLPDDTLSIDLTADSPTFDLTVCASFSGRGLTGPLGKWYISDNKVHYFVLVRGH